MPIKVACQCGQAFAAKDELAGKRVGCPSCGQALTIPARSPQPSQSGPPIPVACQCGRRFQAPAKLAGKQLACPACGGAIAIPYSAGFAPAPVAAPDPLADPLSMPLPTTMPVTPGAVGRPVAGRPAPLNKPKWLLIGGVIAAVSLIGLVVVGVFVAAIIRGGLAPASTLNPQWEEFVSDEGGYSIRIFVTPPGVPSIEGSTGDFGAKSQLSADGPATMVNSQRAEDRIGPGDAQEIADRLGQHFRESLQADGKFISETDHMFDEWPGKIVTGELTEDFVTVRIQYAAVRTFDRVHILMFTAREDLFKEEQAREFLDSFRLRGTPEQQALQVAAAPTALPEPPLGLSPAAPPPSTYNNTDLTQLDADQLFSASMGARREGNFPVMTQLQYWGVANSKTDGLYNLACCYGLNGESDAAFYWLQQAAIVEGVDAAHASTDSDFDSVRDDPRWVQVLGFLAQCNAYWRTQSTLRIHLVFPSAYQNDRPIPVLVGLHGLGHNPKGFMSRDYYQTVADQMDVAVVTVSGTRPSGPNSYSWAEEAADDDQQVQKALASVARQVKIQPGSVVLFGFSQGGAVAAALVANYPERYAGAIALSAGTRQVLDPPPTPPTTIAQRRGIFVCGDGEHPATLATTSKWADWFKQQGAQVTHKEYPGMNTHSFPPDFDTAFPGWVRFVLKRGN